MHLRDKGLDHDPEPSNCELLMLDGADGVESESCSLAWLLILNIKHEVFESLCV